MEMLARYRGALLGLAAGDALGTTLEFQRPGTFTPIQEIIGGGPFYLEPGQWTDDTSMALCLADSLISQNGFDPIDQLTRYCRWAKEGYFSSIGRCFDIGRTTSDALSDFLQTKQPYCGPTGEYSAGNGCIMRLAPVPMFFRKNPTLAIERSADSSRTTHGATECVDASRYFGALIVGALEGRSKEELLAADFWKSGELTPNIATIVSGSFKLGEPPFIKGSGYVVKALEAALWAFHRSNSFREGALMAVNLGDDADTTGAIYGQIAGAFYGDEAIPAHWRKLIAMRETIEQLAEQLYRCSESA